MSASESVALTPAQVVQLDERLVKYGADTELILWQLKGVQLAKFAGYVSDLHAELQVELPAEIVTGDDERRVNNNVANCARNFDGLEEVRRTLLMPKEKEIKDLNAFFRCITGPAKERKDAGLALVVKNTERKNAERERIAREEREAQEQAARDLEAAAAAGDTAQVEAAAAAFDAAQARIDTQAAPVRGIKSDAGTSSVSYVWHARVVDASLVPREWLVVDLARLDAVAKAQGERAPEWAAGIPGVEAYSVAAPRVRKAGR